MELTPVKSSNIQAIGYEAGLLVVKFIKGGTLYRYRNVPPELHTKLMEAGSKGSFFNRTFGKGAVVSKFPFERVPAYEASLYPVAVLREGGERGGTPR